jgi:hypothetical protein
MAKERFLKRSECIRSGQILNVFVVVSKTGKTNLSDQKPYWDRDQNKNHRMWIRIQKAPGYVSGNDQATDLSPANYGLTIELQVVWRIHQILIQNQFSRRP